MILKLDQHLTILRRVGEGGEGEGGAVFFTRFTTNDVLSELFWAILKLKCNPNFRKLLANSKDV
jgi:hypothetical protein